MNAVRPFSVSEAQGDYLLELDRVWFRYEPSASAPYVVEDFSFSLAPHESVALVGPNGVGKTTLGLLAFGLLQPTSGTVRYRRTPIGGPIEEGAIVFQRDALLPWLTALDNVALALECRGVRRKERREQAMLALAELGVDNAAMKYPHQLSGGMRQRVALARALVIRPALLVLDEAMSNLDAPTREKLQEEICRERERRKFALLVITHDVDEAAYLMDRCVVLSSGPAQPVQEISSPFGPERPGEIRATEAFAALRTRLWTELRSVCADRASQWTAVPEPLRIGGKV